jgi:nucleoredoxin
MALNKLFGDTLLTKSGAKPTDTVLSGKTAIGIYFSAHWCPPCRGFTPKFAEMYSKAFQSLGMEVVFVSSDRNEEAFNSYFEEMPWTALPYANRDMKAALSKKYKVQGIPTLVIIDAEGKTITTEGLSAVQRDTEGKHFPWKPKPFAEVIGDRFLKGDDVVGKEALEEKTLAIYFSAHWCPPCRAFTPVLAEHYKKYKEAGKPLELVFSTADQSEAEFESYRTEMKEAGGDWLSIPFADKETRSQLDDLFQVQGIPKLVIVGEDGRIINDNAVRAVRNDGSGSDFPWAPPAVGDLAAPEGIDETPSICIFMEETDADMRSAIHAQVENVAQRYIDEGKANDEDPKYRFYIAKANEGAVPKLRRMATLDLAPQSLEMHKRPQLQKRTSVETMENPDAKCIVAGNVHVPMLLLDLMDSGAYYNFEGSEITANTIAEFIESYEAKTLKREQLQR